MAYDSNLKSLLSIVPAKPTETIPDQICISNAGEDGMPQRNIASTRISSILAHFLAWFTTPSYRNFLLHLITFY